MKITHAMTRDAAVGDKLTTYTGQPTETWIKLDLDHTGQLSSALQGTLRPYWANTSTGHVVHESCLHGFTVPS